MKIAIFYNFLDSIGGAEELTLMFARSLDADIYTTNVDPDKIAKMGFADLLPRIHSIGSVSAHAPFRQQMTLFHFSKVDVSDKHEHFLITGDWAISAAKHHPSAVWYTHSPLNELWQFRGLIMSEMLSFWQRPLFFAWSGFNRILTGRYQKKIRRIVSNCRGTQVRLKAAYGRESSLIFPPVDTGLYEYGHPQGYWLSVNRLVRHKRVEAQMLAFAKMPDRKLIIVGSYEKGASQYEEYREYLESIRPPNVEMRSWVDSSELVRLYSNCTGALATSPHEDFGMSAIEAMASGKPFVAPNSGGYAESVIHKKTGYLYRHVDDSRNADGLIEGVSWVEHALRDNPGFFADKSFDRARDFDIGHACAELVKVLAEESAPANDSVADIGMFYPYSKPLVSVVVPIRNGAGYLRDFLLSMQGQTYKNYELILVDNTRRGMALCPEDKAVLRSLPKYKVARELRKGRGRARQAGELASSGDIVLMTDIDCTVSPDWIEEMTNPIVNNIALSVQGSDLPEDRNSFWSAQQALRSEDKWEAIHELSKKSIQGLIDTKNFAIRKDVLAKIGFSDCRYVSGNDTALSIRLSSFCERIRDDAMRGKDARVEGLHGFEGVAFLDEVKVRHRHPDSFFKLLYKQLYRGYWTAVITKDYREMVDAAFKSRTAQTVESFFRMPDEGKREDVREEEQRDAPRSLGGKQKSPAIRDFDERVLNRLKAMMSESNQQYLFDFVSGFAWRIGILFGRLWNAY